MEVMPYNVPYMKISKEKRTFRGKLKVNATGQVNGISSRL